MTTTDPDSAYASRDCQSQFGAVGPNSHHAHTGPDGQLSGGVVGPNFRDAQSGNARQGRPGVAGPNLADPVQFSGGSHCAPGGVGDPSTVNAQGFRESQDRIGVDGSSSHDAQAPDECHPGFGIVGPTPTDPPRDNAWAIPLSAGSSAPAPPGASIASPNARTSAACSKVQTPPAAPIRPAHTKVLTASLATLATKAASR